MRIDRYSAGPRFASITKWAAAATFLVLTSICFAEAPPLVQYSHKAWRTEEGAIPGVPAAITQTADGYVWIGTATGLFLFDGLQFTKFVPPPELTAKLSNVFALFTDARGTLWIGTQSDIFSYRDGKLTLLPGPIGRINGFVEDPAGQIWFARSRPVGKLGGFCRITPDGFACQGAAENCSYSGSIALDRAGAISIGGDSSLCQLREGVISTIEPDTLKFTKELQGVSALQADSDGALLVGFLRSGSGLGLERLVNGVLTPLKLLGLDATLLSTSALLRDKQSGLWIGTGNAGLLHSHNGRVDRITTASGLSGTRVTTIFQDASQDVWVGTSGGLDLFRRSDVSSFGVTQGLATEEVPSVLALRDGRVLAGGVHGLSIITRSGTQVIAAKEGLPGQLVTAMYEDHEETVWLGVDDNLVKWRDGRFAIVNAANGEPVGPIYSIAGAADGSIWATVVARPDFKVFRIEPGRAPQIWPMPEGVSLHHLETDPHGEIWAAGRTGSLLRFEGHSFVSEAVPSRGNTVNGLYFDHNSMVWSATKAGLKGWKAGRWAILDHTGGLPCDEVESMVQSAGMLWLDMQCGYFSVPVEQIDQFGAGILERVKGTLYPTTSGARTGLSTFSPAAVRGPEQQLWFANDGPLQLIDVNTLSAAPAPPPVHIDSISVDGQALPLAKRVLLPTLARDITIGYAAIDFSDPFAVGYRYRLGGKSKDWTDVGARRTALFSNLKPGRYTFKVTAAASDGVWGAQGDSIEFVIPPTFYQTLWFRSLMVMLALLTLWGWMALRIRRASAALELRMGERLAERDRIARELHDTLLQGVQSILLRFQVVANAMREGKPAETLMQSSLSKADAIIIEIRDKVQDLRVHGAKAGFLIDEIQSILEDLATGDRPALRCIEIGVPRKLLPAVREEFNAIARELIFNAVQHANAANIECVLRYGKFRFAFACIDDGIGIPAEILNSGGRAGHWGLIGVKERAAKLNADVKIESVAGKGTKVAIAMMARTAYASAEASFFSKFLSRLGLSS